MTLSIYVGLARHQKNELGAQSLTKFFSYDGFNINEITTIITHCSLVTQLIGTCDVSNYNKLIKKIMIF